MTAIEDLVLEHCGNAAIIKQTQVQRLWSDFGEIVRLELAGGSVHTVILKHIHPPANVQHPRGWSNTTSMERKLQSYEVEANWYKHYATRTHTGCRVPRVIAVEREQTGLMILMEDLNIELAERRSRLSPAEACTVLSWLASFHAHHLGEPGTGLWPVGTYWHLGTRQDEYAAMADGVVKEAANWLDGQLRNAHFQTLVHGDAKVANFCFSNDLRNTAAVDFQYVGKGPGICDVAYFLGSCLAESTLVESAESLLDFYFSELRIAVTESHRNGKPQCDVSVQALEDEWRSLYSVAWVDFYRFLLGWAPDHQKINTYTRQQAGRLLGTGTR